MKKISFLFQIIISSYCFSQSTIEGFILDESSNNELPYATIKIIQANPLYTITNENGKFGIPLEKVSDLDSLEIRFLGFKTKKVHISHFEKNKNLYLTPNISNLDEVVVVGNKNEISAYKILFDLVKKYRSESTITESKAFLSLTSSARGIPIESIEGFYNNKQSLSEGVVDLILKGGRFGQNKSFPFYSLNNTYILQNFNFFKNRLQFLPNFPGNMSQNRINSRYNVTIDNCLSCGDEDMQISFAPKKYDKRLFSGKIRFSRRGLVIKKIELVIYEPKIEYFSSINDEVQITPQKINLNIIFNPLDYSKIQFFDYTLKMLYNYSATTEVIDTKTFLYFYDYNNPFKEPFLTNDLVLNNDYDKIIASQPTENFWKVNSQFPKSYKELEALEFFKKYGHLINYENSIPQLYQKYTNTSVVLWQKNERLDWSDIKEKNLENNDDEKSTNHHLNVSERSAKISHSASDLKKMSQSSDYNEKFTFSYYLDQHKNEKGEKQLTSRTIFDKNSSFTSSKSTNIKLIYINLMFDIYEYNRQEFVKEAVPTASFDEYKKLGVEKFEKARFEIEKMNAETNFGSNFTNLFQWNKLIKSKLDVDNFERIENNDN